MKIVTCITDLENQVYKTFLEPSCNHFDVELVALVYEGEWRSHRLRDDMLRYYLPQLPPAELIFFADGYDSFVVTGEDEMLAKYAAFDSPIVFSSEDNCWPYEGFADAFPQSPTPRRYLNGGGFIGEAGVVLDLLRRYQAGPPTPDLTRRGVGEEYRSDPRGLDAKCRWSNQYYWTLVFLAHPELIALDYQACLFAPLTLQPTTSAEDRADFKRTGADSRLYRAELERLHEEYEMAGGRLRCRSSGMMPAQVHFNGLVAKSLAANDVFRPLMPWVSSGT